MAYIGFIVILPFAALSIWSIRAVYEWLRLGGYDRSWWRKFGWHAGAGLLLGIWFALFLHYRVAKIEIHGFPIPVSMANLQDNGQSAAASIPALIHFGALITDLLSGVALSLLPIAVALFFKENTGTRDEHGRPRI